VRALDAIAAERYDENVVKSVEAILLMTSADDITAEATAAQGVHDHQLDNVPRRGRRGVPSRAAYQRLIANPFLAVCGLIGWLVLTRWTLDSGELILFLPALASVFLLFFLLQYHCLDCGRTGRLLRWHDHACTRVVARQVSGRPRRLRGPSPTVQTVLWFFAIAFAAFFRWIITP
jgi:hypothetical protein